MHALQLKIIIMKNIFVLLALLTMGSNIFAQVLQIDWQQCYGGADSEYCVDIVEVNNKYLIFGSSASTDGDIAYNHGFISFHRW